MAVAKFNFGVELEGVKHWSGLGRCNTYPKPSLASSDGTTTSLDDMTINFFSLSIFYLTKVAKEQEATNHAPQKYERPKE